MGGFSSVFHAISAAYGWSDKKILNLRIARLVQMMHVLTTREETEVRVRQLEIEWQTKTLASFIANIAPHPKTAEALHKSAENLRLVRDDDDNPVADTSVERGDVRSLEDIMEHGNLEAALKKNAARKGPGLPFM